MARKLRFFKDQVSDALCRRCLSRACLGQIEKAGLPVSGRGAVRELTIDELEVRSSLHSCLPRGIGVV